MKQVRRACQQSVEIRVYDQCRVKSLQHSLATHKVKKCVTTLGLCMQQLDHLNLEKFNFKILSRFQNNYSKLLRGHFLKIPKSLPVQGL